MADQQNWCVKLWGIRGSFSAVGPGFQTYGGNTSCISVDCGDALVVLDAGSGLASLGKFLLRQERRRVDIFIGHLHLDHVMGLFSFVPRFNRNFELHLYGMPGFSGELTRLIGPPLWPIDLTEGPGQVRIHEVWDSKPFLLADGAAPGLTATALDGNHPGGCYYYRLERKGRSLVYALDCELVGDMEHRLTAFASGTDLLIWDASFTPEDVQPGWGHSTWEQGLAVGRADGAKLVLMTHYSANYTDDFLREQERLANQVNRIAQFAREGMVIQL